MRYRWSYLFLLIAISFIILGMKNQEHLIVLKKATNICLECIGVG